MKRRWVRRLAIVVPVLLVGVAIAASSATSHIFTWHFRAEAEREGLSFSFCRYLLQWEIIRGFNPQTQVLGAYFAIPRLGEKSAFPMGPPTLFDFIPRWLMLIAVLFLEVIVWRKTPPTRVRPAFPVEGSKRVSG